MNKKLLFIGFLSLMVGVLLLTPTFTGYAAEEIYVDVNRGSDQNGDGSQSSPYKTITKAVEVADASMAQGKVYVSEGVYNQNSGEKYPLTVKNVELNW